MSLRIYLDVTIIKEVAIKIKNKDGTAAASSKSSDAEIYAVVAKVSKLKGLNINVIGNSLIISKEIKMQTNNKEFLRKGI